MPGGVPALADAQPIGTCNFPTACRVCSTAVVPAPTAKEAVETRTVGIVYDAVMELHLREGHPEHPNRVRQLNHQLHADGLLERCHKLTPKLATDDELLMCHSGKHIARVDNLYMNPLKDDGEPAEREGDTYIITDDIFCNAHTSTAARSAAGCAVQAVRAVLSGDVSTAFAVVRPPGHHAESNELMGFCFFNNVAVAAHAALQQPGIERVLILDWDIHHGNGTQQIFEQDKRVLFVSLHRRDGDFYPQGCGFAKEVGKGEGTGYTVNVPWVSKGMADADYLAAYDLILDPIITQFDPQLVLISAGFDAADGDFLGKCHVTPAGFAALTQRLMRHAGGKLVAVLEGGYEPEIVGQCASAVLKVLLGDTPPALSIKDSFKLHHTTKKVLTSVDSVQRQHWSHLAALPAIAERYAKYSLSLKMQRLSLQNNPSPQPLPLSATEAAPVTKPGTMAAGASDSVQAPLTAPPTAAAAEASDLVELLGALSLHCTPQLTNDVSDASGAMPVVVEEAVHRQEETAAASEAAPTAQSAPEAESALLAAENCGASMLPYIATTAKIATVPEPEVVATDQRSSPEQPDSPAFHTRSKTKTTTAHPITAPPPSAAAATATASVTDISG